MVGVNQVGYDSSRHLWMIELCSLTLSGSRPEVLPIYLDPQEREREYTQNKALETQSDHRSG